MIGLELPSIIAAYMIGLSMLEDHPIQDLKHLGGTHLVPDLDAQGLTGVFIQHGEHLVCSPTGQAIMNEVDAPDMVLV